VIPGPWATGYVLPLAHVPRPVSADSSMITFPAEQEDDLKGPSLRAVGVGRRRSYGFRHAPRVSLEIEASGCSLRVTAGTALALRFAADLIAAATWANECPEDLGFDQPRKDAGDAE
jgi:hypothetical protein